MFAALRRFALHGFCSIGRSPWGVSKTSNGRDVRVSLRRLANPPASSCVQLYTDAELFVQPSIVAADGELLLIHMVVAVKGLPEEQFPPNFFVYKADPDWPSLHRLPVPPDWKARSRDTGILRSGEKGFVVANLLPHIVFNDLNLIKMDVVEVADLWLYKSATKQWETKRLAMPHDPDKGLDEFRWRTDTVFSFHGFLCWADYHRGILYCNVSSSDPELAFLNFTGIEFWDRSDRGIPKWYRTVSISTGELKFVDIDNGRFRSRDDDDNDSTGSLDSCGDERLETEENVGSITIWTLQMPSFEWKIQATLQLDQLWSLLRYQHSHVPRTVPTFPIVSMQKPNVLHFILKGPTFFDKARMVTLDMEKQSVEPPKLYQNPIEAKKDCDIDLSNVFFDKPMISLQLFK